MKTKVLIIGGGLSGLHTAYSLHQQGIDYLLVEARDRLGGRILSKHRQQPTDDATQVAYDLGPAWFWPGQTNLEALVQRLGLVDQIFYQQESGDALYENAEGHITRGIQGISMAGSYRLKGGNAQLITALQQQLPAQSIHLNTRVKTITSDGNSILVNVDNDEQQKHIECEQLVIAAPPRVALQTIDFDPLLSEQRINTLKQIKTWMAGHAKLLVFYASPFWLNQGFSGDCISQFGPLHEIHDASPKVGGPYALFGFLGIPAKNRTHPEPLKQAAIEQLVRLFGEEANDPLEVLYKDWTKDPFTATALDQEMLNHHPTNDIENALEAAWNNRLIWSGSETSDGRFNGYLEGALEASERTIRLLAAS